MLTTNWQNIYTFKGTAAFFFDATVLHVLVVRFKGMAEMCSAFKTASAFVPLLSSEPCSYQIQSRCLPQSSRGVRSSAGLIAEQNPGDSVPLQQEEKRDLLAFLSCLMEFGVCAQLSSELWAARMQNSIHVIAFEKINWQTDKFLQMFLYSIVAICCHFCHHFSFDFQHHQWFWKPALYF